MCKKKTLQALRQIAHKKRVKLRVWRMPYDAYGECRLDGKLISLNRSCSTREAAQTFFHELGHLHCIRKGIWKKYHGSRPTSPEQTFRIENWMEHWARHQWNKSGMYGQFGPYKFFYAKRNRSACLRWIRENA